MDTLESVQHLAADVCRDNYKNILVKQNDQKTRYIIVRCTEHGKFKHLDNRTMKCNIKILTPDKRLIYNTCAIQDDGMVMVALTEAAVRASGVAKAELNIIGIDDSSQLATMTFNLIIKPGVFDDSEIISSNEFGVLTDLIAKEKERIQIVVDLENRISEEEAEWKANEEIRLSNEEERIASESDRADNENQRTENENIRIENENIRIGNENLRQENETARQTSETERNNAEADRNDSEAQRELNETDRISAEDKRSQDEDSRKSAETIRQNAEETRTVSENERNQNEDVRKSNEVIRETNETVRDENELLRQENESSRIDAETKRVADTAAAVSNANNAAELANTAADRANTVAESYETIEFEETATRQQISSGDSLKTLFGKIKKWLSDLKPVAFTGSYNDLDDKPEINVATTEDSGIVKPDGETITVDEDGTIHGSAKVDVATSEKAGVVKPDDKTTVVTEDGTLTAMSVGFTGTQEEYEVADEAGEIPDGAIVNITDDYQEGVGGIAESSKKWETAININGMIVDGSANRSNYFTDTSSRSYKGIYLNATNEFRLVPGALVYVKLVNGRNASGTPQIHIEAWHATIVDVRCNGGGECNYMIAASGEILTFLYTGEYFEHISGGFVGMYFKSIAQDIETPPKQIVCVDYSFKESDRRLYRVDRMYMSWGQSVFPSYWMDGRVMNTFVPAEGFTMAFYNYKSSETIKYSAASVAVFAMPTFSLP